MATKLRLGPADHGLPLTWDEYITGDYAGGHKYEIVDGKLYVSDWPELPEVLLEEWITGHLEKYAQSRPDIINRVTGKAHVFIPRRDNVTAVEPDLSAYHGYPKLGRRTGLSWDQISPVLVVEVLSESHAAKDLRRNVDLYFQVESIAEYWIIDGRSNPAEPTLIARYRDGKPWAVIEVPFGQTYSSKSLPGFKLLVNPLVTE